MLLGGSPAAHMPQAKRERRDFLLQAPLINFTAQVPLAQDFIFRNPKSILIPLVYLLQIHSVMGKIKCTYRHINTDTLKKNEKNLTGNKNVFYLKNKPKKWLFAILLIAELTAALLLIQWICFKFDKTLIWGLHALNRNTRRKGRAGWENDRKKYTV